MTSNQGTDRHNQTTQELVKQQGKNDVEFSKDVQVGNSKHQSQKKSGKQVNKK
ncbi:hypothetical protein JOC86_004371 [Bacillus pakistanensis]|uniref:Glycogen biosynthesis protein GlgD n=1 Tax=Rossellomorea pakistanensis TaxID=992288 RepID=A0ABS2NIW2_9BACI|nr:hypothetical protein [Bacillus pakistanensis]MBM7587797.1 hypothetical protein [Bacillus pakistanensis]